MKKYRKNMFRIVSVVLYFSATGTTKEVVKKIGKAGILTT